MINHKGTNTIETGRLILRRFEKTDAEAMFSNWANDPEVTKFLTWPTHEHIGVTEKLMERWVDSYQQDNQYHWAIVPRDYGKPIGSITAGLCSDMHEHCEIGYCVGRSFWGQGITTEALRAVIEYLILRVGYERVGAIHYVDNIASGKVMAKAGMTYEGCMRHYHKNPQGEYYDCNQYGIIRMDLES